MEQFDREIDRQRSGDETRMPVRVRTQTGVTGLVAADDKDIKQRTHNLLSDRGYSVVAASDGGSALALAERRLPNFVVAKFDLPSLDGIQLCRLLKSDGFPGCNHIPVLLLSDSYRSQSVVTLARYSGASAFLYYPEEMDRLPDVVETSLSPSGPPRTAGEQPPPVQRLSDKTRILVADDSNAIANALESILSTRGYDVLIARDGEQATDIIAKERPSLVLLDYRMPRMDGYQVLGWIKSEYPYISVIIVTAHSSDRVAVGMMKAGADDYITKPFTAEDIITTCEEVIEKRDVRVVDHQFRDSLRKLNGAEEKYRQLIENIDDIVYTLDRDGTFTYVNKRWTSILGHRTGEIIGKGMTSSLSAPACRVRDGDRFGHAQAGLTSGGASSPMIHPDDVARLAEALRSVLQTGERIRNIEYRIRHADGSWRYHISNCLPLRDGVGATIGVLGSARDITERKELERKLIHAQNMATIGELTAGINHEIRNPLNSIGGLIETLELRAGKLEEFFNYTLEITNATARKLLEDYLRENSIDTIFEQAPRIYAAIRYGVNAITNIVDSLTRLRGDGRDRYFDIHEGIESTLVLLQSKLNGIEVVRNYSKDIPQFYGQPTKLGQVHYNIMKNAVQAMSDPGGGILTVTTSFCDVSKTIVMSYEDIGCGINEDDRKRIFEPFFTTKWSSDSTGIGLTMCYDIICGYGGQIDVTSKVGIGTEVTVCLPLRLDMSDET